MMKTRTKTKSAKVTDEGLTSTPLQKVLSSTERLQKWRAKLYKDSKLHSNFKKTDQKCKALACGSEKKAREHNDSAAIIYWENVLDVITFSNLIMGETSVEDNFLIHQS